MSTYYIGSIPVSDGLYHYGILGQKWGIRRYQNEDRTLTAAGKERYRNNPNALQEDINKSINSTYDNALSRFKQYSKEIDRSFKDQGGINDDNLVSYLLSQEVAWKTTYLDEITKDY